MTLLAESSVADVSTSLSPADTRPGRLGAWRRRFAHDPAAVTGALVMIVMLSALLLAPLLAGDPTATDTDNLRAPSSWEHPLGTDGIGRDVLSRLMYGGRVSVTLALCATLGITLIGTSMGLLAGFRGGLIDNAIMRVVEILQALPLLIVSAVVIGLFGGGSSKLVIVVALLGWPGYARVIRSSVLSLRERDFISASRALGCSNTRVALRHLLPNLLRPITVLSTLDLGRTLLTLSALSFLGFGVRPPTPEWGSMLAEARTFFYIAPRLLIYPGLAISMFVLSVNLFGDGLRNAFDRRVNNL